MPIAVDIADRLYDYTDEEKAAEAVAIFQDQYDLDDDAVVALWANPNDPMRPVLEKQIFDAVDANGSVRRARESVPSEICLSIEVMDA